MVHLQKSCLPTTVHNIPKLGPFSVVEKIDSNAY